VPRYEVLPFTLLTKVTTQLPPHGSTDCFLLEYVVFVNAKVIGVFLQLNIPEVVYSQWK
jgi:hypothetical protein